jgi:hypothetical protein
MRRYVYESLASLLGPAKTSVLQARLSFRKEGIFKPAFFVIERGWNCGINTK